MAGYQKDRNVLFAGFPKYAVSHFSHSRLCIGTSFSGDDEIGILDSLTELKMG